MRLSAMDIARIMSEFNVSFDMVLNRLERALAYYQLNWEDVSDKLIEYHDMDDDDDELEDLTGGLED